VYMCLAWISLACEKYSRDKNKKERKYKPRKIAFVPLNCATLPKLCPHTEYFPLNIGFLFLKISSSRSMSSPTVLTMFCGKKNRFNSKQQFSFVNIPMHSLLFRLRKFGNTLINTVTIFPLLMISFILFCSLLNYVWIL